MNMTRTKSTKALRRALAVGVMTVALGGLVAPVASAATVSAGAVSAGTPSLARPTSDAGILRTWHATVQCQIVRIRDNNVVGYARADGSGNTEQAAIIDAERNIPVPQGHYKRHCDAKRTW